MEFRLFPTKALPQMAAFSKRIQIVMVEPDQYAQIAAAFADVEMKYSLEAEELDLPAVMENVTWTQYEAFLDALPDRYLRQAYYRGTLELREKTMRQQRTKCVINSFICSAACEFGIHFRGFGSTTLTRKPLQCGVEPDESYFIADEPTLRRLWNTDLGPEDVPAPDLVVETDMDRAYLDRLIVFAAIGVPEVWKYDGTDVVFHRLTSEKNYEPIDASLSFPFLRPEDIHEFLEQRWETDGGTLTKAFLKHVKHRYERRTSP